MTMMYRNADGSYTLSSPDGEHVRHISQYEGEKILIRSAVRLGCPDDLLLKILSETAPGFVLT